LLFIGGTVIPAHERERGSVAVFLGGYGRWPMSLAPIAAVEYLEAALAFASNHNLCMPIAKLDLSNRTAGCVDLPENYHRSHGASRRSARRRVAASPDLNSRWNRIEVRLDHHIVSNTG